MDIKYEVYKSHKYEKCQKVGKAVIVCNFMDKRSYASADCENLQTTLKALGFETLTDEKEMVFKNLTKRQFIDLYKKAAKENYRWGYTCVLFIVMSYGMPGLIKCHAENEDGDCEYVEQKHLQEAFQPQHNRSLALKPKLFIIQTIPEPKAIADARALDLFEYDEIETLPKRIPREADFLTYTCESECINYYAKNEKDKNIFVRSIVEILNDQIKGKAVEIQKLLIKINGKYKEKRDKDKEISTFCKIPCVMSSLTRELYLEASDADVRLSYD